MDLKFAVIGEATAKELERYGWMADLMPEVYNGKELGKALVQMAVGRGADHISPSRPKKDLKN